MIPPIRWCKTVYPLSINLINDIGVISPAFAKKIIEATHSRMTVHTVAITSCVVGPMITRNRTAFSVGALFAAIYFIKIKLDYNHFKQKLLPKLYDIIEGKKFTCPATPRKVFQNGKIDFDFLFYRNHQGVSIDLSTQLHLIPPKLAKSFIIDATVTHFCWIWMIVVPGSAASLPLFAIGCLAANAINHPPLDNIVDDNQRNVVWNRWVNRFTPDRDWSFLLSAIIAAITIALLAAYIFFVRRPFTTIFLPKLEELTNHLPPPS